MNSVDKNESITLEILEAIDEGREVTQRHLASRLGVALGLANSYLKRCIKKGFVKIQQAPANRYLYYLTPSGFAEKSRLTARYLSVSLSFYQKAVASCDALLEQCRAQDCSRVLLCGVSELAEIAALRAAAGGIEVGGILASAGELDGTRGAALAGQAQVVIVTDLQDPAGTARELAARIGVDRIRVPGVLGLGGDFINQLRH